MKEILFEIYEYTITGSLAVLGIIKILLGALFFITFVCLAFSGILLPFAAIFATEIMNTPLWILLFSSIPCTICAIGMIVEHGGEL